MKYNNEWENASQKDLFLSLSKKGKEVKWKVEGRVRREKTKTEAKRGRERERGDGREKVEKNKEE